MEPSAIRRRAINPEITTRRAAAELVRPVHHLLQHWRGNVVLLAALAERGRAHEETDLLNQAETLFERVEVERERLAAALSNLPPQVATHSRVVDTQRALEAVSATVVHALKQMKSSIAL